MLCVSWSSAVEVNMLLQAFEESTFHTSDRRHMLDLIPFILHEEQVQIKEEIDGKYVSVIFDGTTHMGEVLVVVLMTRNGS